MMMLRAVRGTARRCGAGGARARTLATIVHERELRFLLREFIDLDRILDSERFGDHDVETCASIIEAGRTMAEEVFHPVDVLGDREAPTYDGEAVRHPAAIVAAQRQFAAAGFIGMTLGAENGHNQRRFDSYNTHEGDIFDSQAACSSRWPCRRSRSCPSRPRAPGSCRTTA